MKTKIQNRLEGVLPPEELPLFFAALEELAEKPRKSLRLSKRLMKVGGWDADRLRAEGLKLEEAVPWMGVRTDSAKVSDRVCESAAWFFDPKSLPDAGHHPLVAAGVLYIQEASAMEVVAELDVKPGMRVLDLCAAPGGKSTQILDALGGEGFLVANEFNRERVRKLDSMLARWGHLNVAVISLAGDGVEARFAGEFDRVVIDAPCSSESFFAKRKDRRADVSERESLQFQRMQLQLIRNGFRSLRPGGRMIYSTCTYSPLENEAVVESLLGSEGEANLLRSKRRWPHLDRVPGGFWAVIEKKTDGSVDSADFSVWKNGLSSLRERVRVGSESWDGQKNEYALLMSGLQDDVLGEGDLELSTSEAIQYLRRQWSGDQSKKKLRVKWKNHPIGFFHYGKGLHSYLFPQNL